jgi:hypothetical protein
MHSYYNNDQVTGIRQQAMAVDKAITDLKEERI